MYLWLIFIKFDLKIWGFIADETNGYLNELTDSLNLCPALLCTSYIISEPSRHWFYSLLLELPHYHGASYSSSVLYKQGLIIVCVKKNYTDCKILFMVVGDDKNFP